MGTSKTIVGSLTMGRGSKPAKDDLDLARPLIEKTKNNSIEKSGSNDDIHEIGRNNPNNDQDKSEDERTGSGIGSNDGKNKKDSPRQIFDLEERKEE